MASRGFVILLEDLEKTKRLSDKDFRQWVTACVRYMSIGEMPNEEEFSPIAMNSFDFTLPRMEKNIEQMESRAEVNRRNGAKGGRPPKPKEETHENPLGFSGLSENPKNPEEPIPIPKPIPNPTSNPISTAANIINNKAAAEFSEIPDEDLTDEQVMEKYADVPYDQKPLSWYNARKRICFNQMEQIK